MLDNTVVNVALPSIERDLGARPLRARVDRLRLCAHVCRVPSHGRQARRPLRPAADPRGRARDLRRLLARLRPRPQRRLPDRRPRRSGSRRGAHEPRHPLDHHRDIPAAAARNGDRDLGRSLGHGTGDRAARRRAADGARGLELDLLRQRPDRRGGRSPPASCSSTSRETPRGSSASTSPAWSPPASASSRSRTR